MGFRRRRLWSVWVIAVVTCQRSSHRKLSDINQWCEMAGLDTVEGPQTQVQTQDRHEPKVITQEVVEHQPVDRVGFKYRGCSSNVRDGIRLGGMSVHDFLNRVPRACCHCCNVIVSIDQDVIPGSLHLQQFFSSPAALDQHLNATRAAGASQSVEQTSKRARVSEF